MTTTIRKYSLDGMIITTKQKIAPPLICTYSVVNAESIKEAITFQIKNDGCCNRDNIVAVINNLFKVQITNDETG